MPKGHPTDINVERFLKIGREEPEQLDAALAIWSRTQRREGYRNGVLDGFVSSLIVFTVIAFVTKWALT